MLLPDWLNGPDACLDCVSGGATLTSRVTTIQDQDWTSSVSKLTRESKTRRKTINRGRGSSHTDKTGQNKTSRVVPSCRCGTPITRQIALVQDFPRCQMPRSTHGFKASFIASAPPGGALSVCVLGMCPSISRVGYVFHSFRLKE